VFFNLFTFLSRDPGMLPTPFGYCLFLAPMFSILRPRLDYMDPPDNIHIVRRFFLHPSSNCTALDLFHYCSLDYCPPETLYCNASPPIAIVFDLKHKVKCPSGCPKGF